MGWTFTHKEKGLSVKDFFQNEFRDAIDILECRTKHFNECYMAVRQKATGKVFAMVCLIQYCNDYYNFGYKDMDEDCGPCYWDCPESILKRLTPTNSEYAKNWREGCWNTVNQRKKARKVKNGDKIIFAEPVSFSNGDKIREFEVFWVRNNQFRTKDNNYYIHNWKNREFELIPA